MHTTHNTTQHTHNTKHILHIFGHNLNHITLLITPSQLSKHPNNNFHNSPLLLFIFFPKRAKHNTTTTHNTKHLPDFLPSFKLATSQTSFSTRGGQITYNPSTTREIEKIRSRVNEEKMKRNHLEPFFLDFLSLD